MKGGREEVWPLPKEVKEAIDHYLRLDRRRKEIVHSGGEDAHLFQPLVNYRTLEFDRALSIRMVQRIVKRWADYARLGDLSPHDLRRTAITRAPDAGLSYRQVRMMSKHRDPKTIMRYDHGREWSRTPSTSWGMTRSEGLRQPIDRPCGRRPGVRFRLARLRRRGAIRSGAAQAAIAAGWFTHDQRPISTSMDGALAYRT